MANRRTALVTGASRGIGRAIAEHLGGAGWNVVLNYHASADAAAEAARAVIEAGGQARVVQADVGRLEDHAALVEAALETFGSLELLVNNAGVPPAVRADLLQMSEQSYDRVLDTNLKGAFFLTQRVANQMLHARPQAAAIINIGSISAYTASINRGEYCMSKAGMGMMTKLFADRLAEDGINVYEVRPGIIATDMTAKVKDKYDRLIEQGLTPLRRWGRPQDLARAVLSLAQGDFPFSTGEVINVDGGFHLHRL